MQNKLKPRTRHEGPEEGTDSYTLSLTSPLDGVGGQRHAPAALPAEERPGTNSIWGWVSSRAGLDEKRKSHPHRVSILGTSNL
jgi:hypothetical protein